MDRRELAKKGFLGLCSALLGKKPEPETPVNIGLQLTYSSGTYGKWTRIKTEVPLEGERNG